LKQSFCFIAESLIAPRCYIYHTTLVFVQIASQTIYPDR